MTDKDNKIEVGRLAMREVGEYWIAYYAMSDTMDNAIFLGSISIGIARIPKFKKEFMELMKQVVSELIKMQIGQVPEWENPKQAPENERFKNG